MKLLSRRSFIAQNMALAGTALAGSAFTIADHTSKKIRIGIVGEGLEVHFSGMNILTV